MEISLLAVLIGGILTVLSPCGALLLPSFFALAFERRSMLLARAGVFLLGVAVVMVPLGFGASAIGGWLLRSQDTLLTVAGAGLIVMAVLMLLGRGRGTSRLAARWQQRFAGETSPVAIAGLGAVYGLAGSCAGPILGTVLTIAALQQDPLRGGALMGVYAIGVTLPVLVLASLWSTAMPTRIRSWQSRTVRLGRSEFSIVTLLTAGAMLLAGVWLVLAGAEVGPALGLPGVGDTTRLDLQLQAWALRVGERIPDGALLGGAAVVVLGVLGQRIRTRRAGTTVRR